MKICEKHPLLHRYYQVMVFINKIKTVTKCIFHIDLMINWLVEMTNVSKNHWLDYEVISQMSVCQPVSLIMIQVYEYYIDNINNDKWIEWLLKIKSTISIAGMLFDYITFSTVQWKYFFWPTWPWKFSFDIMYMVYLKFSYDLYCPEGKYIECSIIPR